MQRLIRFVRQHTWSALAVALVVLIGLGGLGWRLWHVHQENNPNNEVKVLIKKVGRHILLPTDESPGLVTVVDKTKIQNIPFLQHSAENGDKMLVYAKAHKAILYRPSIDKLIDVGPVSIADLSQDKNK